MNVPREDHICRHCTPRVLAESRTEVTAAAFVLREGESYLSVSWLEGTGLATELERLEAVRRYIAAELTVRESHILAQLNVGRIHDHLAEQDCAVRVTHEATTENPVHCCIRDVPPELDLVPQLIADCVEALHPAK